MTWLISEFSLIGNSLCVLSPTPFLLKHAGSYYPFSYSCFGEFLIESSSMTSTSATVYFETLISNYQSMLTLFEYFNPFSVGSCWWKGSLLGFEFHFSIFQKPIALDL